MQAVVSRPCPRLLGLVPGLACGWFISLCGNYYLTGWLWGRGSATRPISMVLRATESPEVTLVQCQHINDWKRMKNIYTLALFGLGALGCVSYSVLPTPGKTGSAKAIETCSFEVLARQPAGNFEEIGTISVTSATSSPEKFQSAIKEDVCRLGGDVVVTEVNGLGQIVRGVVLRRI